MIVLALDLATRVGWATDGLAGPIHGTRQLPKGDRAAALYMMGRFLKTKVSESAPDLIVFETPVMTGPGLIMAEATARLLIGMAGVVEAICHSMRIEYADVPVNTIRKFFTDNGRAKKADVLERCHQIGWSPKDDNEADALALWAYAKALRDKEFRVETVVPLFTAGGSREGQGSLDRGGH